MSYINSIIVATGSHIPEREIPNTHFKDYQFFTYKNGIYVRDSSSGLEVADQYSEKTGIISRRYVIEGRTTSDIAAFALKNTGYDLDSLDMIIVAHNFGDFNEATKQGEAVPSISSRVKGKAALTNPNVKTFDLLGGCPGWLQALDIADSMIKAGKAKSIAVIGAETLSYFSDPHNKDSTIFADGAGAVILSAVESDKKEGILSYAGRTDADKSHLLTMVPSVNPDYDQNELLLRMIGPKVYRYAVKYVTSVIEESLQEAKKYLGDKFEVKDINMFLAHQANERLDADIIKKLLHKNVLKELLTGHVSDLIYGLTPLTINLLGNSSVATIPTLLDLLVKGNLSKYTLKRDKENKKLIYRLNSNDVICLFSVGAGMNTNAMFYLAPEAQHKYFPQSVN